MRGKYNLAQGKIRIIGGQWRGRKLIVPDMPDLRPTPDRVRETLFNWLSPIIQDSYCLDAFAGSGILGFEALSRGASGVVMIDQSKQIVKILQEEALMLKTSIADIYQAKLPFGIKKPKQKFNIVFLDPPFQQNLLFTTCDYLEKNDFLAENAYIYLEAPQAIKPEQLPSNWNFLKNEKAGQVAYHLAIRQDILST